MADLQQGDGVVAADGGAVAVDAAALVAVEQQAGALVGGLELDPRQAVAVHLEGDRVLGQEVGGGHAHPVLEADDVVGGEGDVGLLAAGVETGDALVAAELDLGRLVQGGGHDRAREGDLGLLVGHRSGSSGATGPRGLGSAPSRWSREVGGLRIQGRSGGSGGIQALVSGAWAPSPTSGCVWKTLRRAEAALPHLANEKARAPRGTRTSRPQAG